MDEELGDRLAGSYLQVKEEMSDIRRELIANGVFDGPVVISDDDEDEEPDEEVSLVLMVLVVLVVLM